MKNILLILSLLIGCSAAATAGEPIIWSVNSKEDVIKGNSKGVSIDDDGSIRIAQKLDELFDTTQPYVWSSAFDKSGNVFLGTGGEGKVFRVDSAGKGKLFYDAAEINVSALAVDSGGTVYAGTSPDGKVYRITSDGKASVYFDPKEKYIWSLAVFADGSLAVGTGENGTIYKVSAANADPKSSLFFDTSETHIISLAADKNGNLFAGTDSSGFVLRFSPDGRPFGLLDSSLREIHEIAVGIDGSVYVLALGESASTKEKKPDEKKREDKTVSVAKKSTTPAAKVTKSRYDLSSAKSAVYRILPDGGHDLIWKSDDFTAFSLYAHLTGNGVLIGTSDKGRIYSVRNDGRVKLALQTDEEQVSTISTFGNKLYATSSNKGKLYRFGGEELVEGIFESPVLDAKSVATWGTIWWRSEGNVEIQTRSGNTAVPNEIWSDWSAALRTQRGAKVTSPAAQYFQWRSVLKSSNVEAVLHEVNLSYLSRNIPPEVLSIEVLPSNIGLAPVPPVPVDPNIRTLGLNPRDFGIVVPPAVPRKVFQSGAKSLQWKAADRNDDRLSYSIYYRPVDESKYKLLRSNIARTFFTIDGRVLADGRYVFKIVASDAPSNPSSGALTGERLTDPFDIDNTPPSVTVVGNPQVNGDRVVVTFEANEASSLLKRAEYSVDGSNWKTVHADDGISDGARERYTVRLALPQAGEYAVALRVFDSSGNTGNARVLVRK